MPPTFADLAPGGIRRARVLVRTTTHYHYQRQRNGKSSRNKIKVTSISMAPMGAFWAIGQDRCSLVAGVVTNFGRIGHRQNGVREQASLTHWQMMPITKATMFIKPRVWERIDITHINGWAACIGSGRVKGFAFCIVAPTKRCAGGLPSGSLLHPRCPQETPSCDGFESDRHCPTLWRPGALAKSARPLYGRWLVRRVAAFIA